MGSQVAIVVSNIYMENLEDEPMDTTPKDNRPSMWRLYIDDSFEVVKWDKQDELTEHLNLIESTSSIKFMDEPGMGGGVGSILFWDPLISCKEDG